MADSRLWVKILKMLQTRLWLEIGYSGVFGSLIMNPQSALKKFLTQYDGSKIADPRLWVNLLKMLCDIFTWNWLFEFFGVADLEATVDIEKFRVPRWRIQAGKPILAFYLPSVFLQLRYAINILCIELYSTNQFQVKISFSIFSSLTHNLGSTILDSPSCDKKFFNSDCGFIINDPKNPRVINLKSNSRFQHY